MKTITLNEKILEITKAALENDNPEILSRLSILFDNKAKYAYTLRTILSN